MATYQRRGYKKSADAEIEIVNPENDANSTTAEVFNTLDETANKSEQWVEKNSKPLLIGLVVAVVGIFGYMGYNQFVVAPKEKEASNALVFAKQQFSQANNAGDKDLFTKSLEGADGNYGLLDIADNYGSTNAGNLAKYYAGLSYINLGEYATAVEYLSEVATNDAVLNTIVNGAIGDAYLAQANNQEAFAAYSKAAELSDNNAVAPVYLLKAGKVALALNNATEAQNKFATIKNDFPKSNEAKNIDLYINQAKYNN
ncbi:tetratricopeptide repeat protein [Flavobacteriaceae bacterium]|nr:tetratricopeptide repeat protein [Flavobacteriaceae bacterium]